MNYYDILLCFLIGIILINLISVLIKDTVKVTLILLFAAAISIYFHQNENKCMKQSDGSYYCGDGRFTDIIRGEIINSIYTKSIINIFNDQKNIFNYVNYIDLSLIQDKINNMLKNLLNNLNV